MTFILTVSGASLATRGRCRGTVAEIEAPHTGKGFWEMPASWGRGSAQRLCAPLCSLGAALWPLVCVRPEPAPQAKAPGQANRPSSPKDSGVFHCYLGSALGVAECQELSLQLLQPCGRRVARPSGLQSREIRGCPLGGNLKNWGTRCVNTPLHEILAIWSHGRGRMYIDGS